MDENRNEMDKMENTNHAGDGSSSASNSSNASNTSNAGNTSNSNNDTTQDYCPCCPNHCQADALECGKGTRYFQENRSEVNTFGSIIMDKAMGFMEDVPDILTGKTCPWRISFCTSSVPVPTSSATEWAERQASREYWPCWRKGESSHSGSFRTCWECSQVPSARFSIR